VNQGLLLIDVSKVKSGISEEVVGYDTNEITARRQSLTVVGTTCKAITTNVYVKASEDLQGSLPFDVTSVLHGF